MAPALAHMTASIPGVGAQLRWTPSHPQQAAGPPRRQRQLQQQQRAAVRAAVADRSSGTGGAVVDRSGLDRSGVSSAPQTDSYGSQLGTSGGRGTGGGSWRLLLVDSEHHTEERVVNAIVEIVPGVQQPHAANCFHTVSHTVRFTLNPTSTFFC